MCVASLCWAIGGSASGGGGGGGMGAEVEVPAAMWWASGVGCAWGWATGARGGGVTGRRTTPKERNTLMHTRQILPSATLYSWPEALSRTLRYLAHGRLSFGAPTLPTTHRSTSARRRNNATTISNGSRVAFFISMGSC